MTVLLIDASGHKREYQISHLVRVIYVPIPKSDMDWFFVSNNSKPVYKPLRVATFEYSNEPSFPPVFRQKL